MLLVSTLFSVGSFENQLQVIPVDCTSRNIFKGNYCIRSLQLASASLASKIEKWKDLSSWLICLTLQRCAPDMHTMKYKSNHPVCNMINFLMLIMPHHSPVIISTCCLVISHHIHKCHGLPILLPQHKSSKRLFPRNLGRYPKSFPNVIHQKKNCAWPRDSSSERKRRPVCRSSCVFHQSRNSGYLGSRRAEVVMTPRERWKAWKAWLDS